MTNDVATAVFEGIRNFHLEVFQMYQEDGEDPFSGVVDMMPARSLPPVRAFIEGLLRDKLHWGEMDRRWRDAGSNMLFASEEQMRAFLREVLRQIDCKLATARP